MNSVLKVFWIEYLSHIHLIVNADGLDPTIMPIVNAPTPRGLNWQKLGKLFMD